MKRAEKSVEAIRNFEQLISKFAENEILNIEAMSYIRGGSADGNGSEPIIIIPKPL
jgi:hypothetical protein